MPYDEYLAERITRIIEKTKMPYYAKKMMGGLCYMVNDKMACGIHFDKKKQDDLLMARIGEKAAETNMKKNGCCLPMDFTGRPMRNYVFITPDGFDSEKDLEYWIQLCLDFNPEAKASKKRKKKTD